MSPWGEKIVFGGFDDRFNLLEAGVRITVCLLVVHAAVADVEDPGALGHDHLKYNTVQYIVHYSTLQYNTVQQYSTVQGAHGLVPGHLQLVLQTVVGDVLQRPVPVVVVKLEIQDQY